MGPLNVYLLISMFQLPGCPIIAHDFLTPQNSNFKEFSWQRFNRLYVQWVSIINDREPGLLPYTICCQSICCLFHTFIHYSYEGIYRDICCIFLVSGSCIKWKYHKWPFCYYYSFNPMYKSDYIMVSQFASLIILGSLLFPYFLLKNAPFRGRVLCNHLRLSVRLSVTQNSHRAHTLSMYAKIIIISTLPTCEYATVH